MFSVVLVALAMGLGVLVGVLVTLAARRARRLDDHPTCRRCRFDLVGLGERVEACPECGTDLTGPRAVRVGNRRAHRPLVALGAVVMLGSLLIGGGVVALRVTGADINRLKPAWMLAREAEAVGSSASVRALAELTRRVQNASIGSGVSRRLVASGLARQADPAAGWDAAWGDFLDAAWLAGEMTPEDRAAFLLNSLQYTLTARPVLAVGASPGLRLDLSAARLGNNTSVDVDFELIELRIGGEDNTARVTGSFRRAGASGGSSWSTPLIKVRSPLGDQKLSSRWRVRLADPEIPALTREVTLERSVRVLAEGEPIIELVTDARIRAMLENAISVPRLAVDEKDGVRASFDLAYEPLVCAVIGDTFLREPAPPPDAGDSWKPREWKMGTHHLHAIGNASSTGWNGIMLEGPAGFDLEVVDVVLKPSVWSAVQDPDVERIWGEELVIRGVKVERVESDL
jgi:hypothetical protein